MPLSLETPNEVAEILMGKAVLSNEVVSLNINQFTINLRSNSDELLDWCRHYFSYVLLPEALDKADIEIVSVERQPVELDIDYHDWVRAEKAKARKDAIYDIPGARILKKVRTGMVFLQSKTHLIAAGECLKNNNQIINFINAQYMSHIQNNHGITCHAAGLVMNKQGKEHVLGMAGFSGGGKSTLMLHMLGETGNRFLSNDRLFIQKNAHDTQAIGIPKLPRINPGTIIYNPKLQNLISPERREELLQLPSKELWDLEEKYDVFIDESYGPDKIQYQGVIEHFVVLNWSHDSQDPVQLNEIDLNQRRDLLAPIMKSPGPFYQKSNGDLYQYNTPLNEQSYLDVFEDIHVYEASGQVDFQTLSRLLTELSY